MERDNVLYLNEFYLSDDTKEITITYAPSKMSPVLLADVLDFVIDALNASMKNNEKKAT